MKWMLMLVLALALFSGEVLAKRLGAGKSVGRQSANVSQSHSGSVETAPPRQGQNVAPPAGGAATVAPVVPARQPSRVAGVLGGLAAGLGLAWLASSLGMGSGLAPVLLLLVLLMVGWGVLSRLRRVRTQLAQSSTQSGNALFAYPGVSDVPTGMARPYRPENVGNDASARPFERSNLAPLDGPAAEPAAPGWHIPPEFDVPAFLAAARTNFIALQAAWDRADIAVLRSMMTDAMLHEIQGQLAERERFTGTAVNVTEVVMLEARLLGIEETPRDYLASVEFSGLIREDPSAGASPFREVWNMSKPRDGTTGWLVAGVQALQ